MNAIPAEMIGQAAASILLQIYAGSEFVASMILQIPVGSVRMVTAQMYGPRHRECEHGPLP